MPIVVPVLHHPFSAPKQRRVQMRCGRVRGSSLRGCFSPLDIASWVPTQITGIDLRIAAPPLHTLWGGGVSAPARLKPAGRPLAPAPASATAPPSLHKRLSAAPRRAATQWPQFDAVRCEAKSHARIACLPQCAQSLALASLRTYSCVWCSVVNIIFRAYWKGLPYHHRQVSLCHRARFICKPQVMFPCVATEEGNGSGGAFVRYTGWIRSVYQPTAWQLARHFIHVVLC